MSKRLIRDTAGMPPPVSAARGPTTETLAAPYVDPSTFRPDIVRLTVFPTFPTFNALTNGVKPPRLKNPDGSLRQVESWRAELSRDPMTAAKQTAAALYRGLNSAYKYLPYGANLSELRPSVNQGLARGGGECDWFASVAYFALEPIFGKENLAIGQAYSNGGWHNVVFFRNPKTQLWDVMNYEEVVTVGAKSPAEAMRSFFGNVELGVIYRTSSSSQKASILYRVRSDHQATVTSTLAQPGVSGAMDPNFGTTRGLNETTVGAHRPNQQVPGVTGSGVRASNGNATVDVRFGEQGFDRAGVSEQAPVGKNAVLGTKATIVRDQSGKGWNIFVGGEYWHLDDDSYIGVVLGAELRSNIGTQRMEDGVLSTLASAAAVQGGNSVDIVGDKKAPHQVSWFVSGRAQLVAPLVLKSY